MGKNLVDESGGNPRKKLKGEREREIEEDGELLLEGLKMTDKFSQAGWVHNLGLH